MKLWAIYYNPDIIDFDSNYEIEAICTSKRRALELIKKFCDRKGTTVTRNRNLFEVRTETSLNLNRFSGYAIKTIYADSSNINYSQKHERIMDQYYENK